MRKYQFMAMVLVAGMTTAALGQETSFAGKWSGPWTNSLDEKGNSSLKLSEDGDGKLSGTWDDVAVKGERINKNTIELKGKTATRSYQLTGTIKGDTMNLKYIVTRLNMEGSYNGTATLTK